MADKDDEAIETTVPTLVLVILVAKMTFLVLLWASSWKQETMFPCTDSLKIKVS